MDKGSNLENDDSNSKLKDWLHPNKVMQLYRLKLKEKQLKARISRSNTCKPNSSKEDSFQLKPDIETDLKRKNPFICSDQNKRKKTESCIVNLESSADQTLFNLFNCNKEKIAKDTPMPTSFSNVLNKTVEESSEIFKEPKGEIWIPVDWSLKSKMRFISERPFPWNQKLKISEEASGITSFVRCLDSNSKITLDTSPNAKFHQCCLYWQQPVFPWLKLFPRTGGRISSTGVSVAASSVIKDSLKASWSDSIRSLFQLIRTRQCPYFYVCANNFTILFRAAGICGYSETHVLISPTTRGFRQLLRQEEIEFRMPLKKKRNLDQEGYDTLDSTTTHDALVVDEETNKEMGEKEGDQDDDEDDEDWLRSMGVNAEQIKKINYKQQNIKFKAECQVDNSEQSLVLVEGVEVNAFFNFLLNCKSAVSTTGPLAGIPPTLLAPVAFNGATLCALKVRERKVNFDNVDYYSLELNGPILPQVVHNLCQIYPKDKNNFTVTFAIVNSSASFSKITNNKLLNNSSAEEEKNEENHTSGSLIFGQTNLTDCGLNLEILKHFCSPNSKHVANVECLKYTTENKTYTWT